MRLSNYLITEKNVRIQPDEIKALKAKFKKGKNGFTSVSTDNRGYFTIMKMVDKNPDETFGWEITKDKDNYKATHYYTMYQADDSSPDKSEDFKVPVSQGIDALVKRLEKEFKG